MSVPDDFQLPDDGEWGSAVDDAGDIGDDGLTTRRGAIASPNPHNLFLYLTGL
jgi:hypothetical protein